MNRSLLAVKLLGLLFPLLSPAFGETPRPDKVEPLRFEQTHATMGTEFRIILYCEDEQRANEAFQTAKDRLDSLNAALSDYVSTSEVSRLSRSSGRPYGRLLHDDLWEVLVSGQQLAEQTKGAFDITVGPLTRLWRVSRRSGKLPSEKRLALAKESTGYAHLAL